MATQTYFDLLTQNLRLQAEVNALKEPPLDEGEREKRITDIRAFFLTMNTSQGAVTASNLYGKDFFEATTDRAFRKELLDFLIERFAPSQLLIDGTYNYWLTINEAR